MCKCTDIKEYILCLFHLYIKYVFHFNKTIFLNTGFFESVGGACKAVM